MLVILPFRGQYIQRDVAMYLKPLNQLKLVIAFTLSYNSCLNVISLLGTLGTNVYTLGLY